MRVGIYDRYWSTMGGGERYAARIAQALARDHEVTLLVHDPPDLGRVEERLDVDLAGVGIELVADSPVSLHGASSRFDLFVNATFDSAAPSAARRSVYVAFFPSVPVAALPLRRAALRGIGRRLVGDAPVVVATGGLHPPEVRRQHLVRWTDGCGRWHVAVPAAGGVPVRLALGRYLPPGAPPAPVELRQVGRGTIARAVLEPARGPLDRRRVVVLDALVDRPLDGAPGEIELVSDTHRPCDVGGGPADVRTLGVPVLGIVAGGGPRRRVAAALPAVLGADAVAEALTTYERIVAISEFSRRWVHRRWGRDADLLYPPVPQRAPGRKGALIVSVGRFFPPGAFHAKHQLELVRSFATMHAAHAAGWVLHLVGPCRPEHRPYLDEVRAAAAGSPVEIHLDAPATTLADLYGRASIYWHAAGLGEDEERHPERLEHFGITTAEAMSAGAVPVVLGAGGQREVVRHGVDGFHFREPRELVALTERLIDDAPEREAMSAAARDAVRRFSVDAFDAAARALAG